MRFKSENLLMLREKKRLTWCFSLLLPIVAVVALVIGVLGRSWPVREVSAANEPTGPFRLVAVWAEAGLNQDLKSWTLSELSKFKKTESRERDPNSGKLVKWKGVLLSHLIDKVLVDLSPENRAHIDLVVLKGGAGNRALIPRAMITKYPVMLALQTSTPDSGMPDLAFQNRGPVYSVIPWSTKPKILDEGLPLENYFVSNLERIELTSYKDRFSSLFLKRRTDPSAMRGEKLFVQNCIGCHADGDTKVYQFGQVGSTAAAEHPAMKAVLKLGEKEKKSLVSYLNAYKAENPEPSTSGTLLKPAESAQKSFVQ
ncbi:MAG: hypothetical protein ABIQ95_10915 [Bdellovibrionia bacterium]